MSENQKEFLEGIKDLNKYSFDIIDKTLIEDTNIEAVLPCNKCDGDCCGIVPFKREHIIHIFNKYTDSKKCSKDVFSAFKKKFPYSSETSLKKNLEFKAFMGELDSIVVEFKDMKATRRTQAISQNAQWFEDHSPVAPQFKKAEVKGVTAHVICAAMLGGDEYPASAIGINLPNANWIRQEYGSKSVTIGNLTEAYNKAAQGNGFRDEFVIDEDTISLMNQYEDITDDLHTDLHECLGHGSGQLLPGTDPDALKAYGSTIEEARADLFGLYYVADHKLVELGLTPNDEAYKAQYYGYLMNGLLTQTIRIKEGDKIEEAHMRNRALIAWWVMEHAEGAVELVKMDMNYASAEDALKDSEGNIITTKTYVKINDYAKLRHLFGELLAEIQRIKSEGDFEAARLLVEKYAVNIDPELHREILARYKKLNLAPYKGFINPKMTLVFDEEGNPVKSVVNKKLLEDIAESGRGVSYFLENDNNDIIKDINAQLSKIQKNK